MTRWSLEWWLSLAAFAAMLNALYYGAKWRIARRCAWCNRSWAWRRRKAGVRTFPICRRCARAHPRERIRSVRIAHPHPKVGR